MATHTRPEDLKPGDRYLRPSYNDDPPITIEVLKPQEPCKDLFGRDMIRYWCRRLDTGAEGYMTYGPGAASVEMASERVTVFVRVGSHRARHKLESSYAGLGYRPRYYFSWKRRGEWAEVPKDALDRLLAITGITAARRTDDLNRCIKWT